MQYILPTGCNSIDNLLGGGIHYGMVTDIYGESGTGKSQLCFTICARSAEYFEHSQQARVVFIDTGGTFRPERIREINLRCAVVITNMVRTMATAGNQVKSSEITTENPNMSKTQQSDHQRELMGTSVSIYAHMKLVLKDVKSDKSVFKAVLLQPSRKQEAYYTITGKGVTDLR